MISDPLQLYIDSHISPEPENLARIYRHTQLTRLYPRMCTDHHQGRVLKMLTAMIDPRNILELGTFTGYSTLCFAEATPPGVTIDTVEIDDEAAQWLRDTFDASARRDDIHLHIGDALDVVPTLDAPHWDLAFIDANKRHYCKYLDLLAPRISPGGYILADNTLWSEKVINPDTSHHHDAQLQGIMDFNDRVAADPMWETVILPIRDGLTILRKISV